MSSFFRDEDRIDHVEALDDELGSLWAIAKEAQDVTAHLLEQIAEMRQLVPELRAERIKKPNLQGRGGASGLEPLPDSSDRYLALEAVLLEWAFRAHLSASRAELLVEAAHDRVRLLIGTLTEYEALRKVLYPIYDDTGPIEPASLDELNVWPAPPTE